VVSIPLENSFHSTIAFVVLFGSKFVTTICTFLNFLIPHTALEYAFGGKKLQYFSEAERIKIFSGFYNHFLSQM